MKSWKFVADWAEAIDKSIGWAKLPTPLALPVLIGLRDRLRERNLYDTGRGPLDKPPFTDPNQADYRGARTLDGTYNDLNDPLMGSIGSRFGRNVPLQYSWHEEPPELYDPNPRLISRKLLTRESFQPATTLNLLAGAWIQFEVHDWFSHGDNDP
ncbi:MAG TPA: peroxidase family protein, partial [Gaiellaceae bacterium]|nr:peroxidase family protein [Gaiellaceae bacterium]